MIFSDVGIPGNEEADKSVPLAVTSSKSIVQKQIDKSMANWLAGFSIKVASIQMKFDLNNLNLKQMCSSDNKASAPSIHSIYLWALEKTYS